MGLGSGLGLGLGCTCHLVVGKGMPSGVKAGPPCRLSVCALRMQIARSTARALVWSVLPAQWTLTWLGLGLGLGLAFLRRDGRSRVSTAARE